MATKPAGERTRTTFTFAKATVALRVAQIARERGCSIQDVINEAVDDYVRAETASIRSMCVDLVAQHGRLIALIERTGGAGQAPVRAMAGAAPLIPPPVMIGGAAQPISDWEIPSRNPWDS